MFSLLSIVALYSAAWCGAALAQPVAFKTIDRGEQTSIEEGRQVVVRTQEEWTALWGEYARGQARPAVDFARAMVVGVFLGSRPTGGYGVEITRIEREGADLVVTYRERRPDPANLVTQVITTPYHLVTIGRSGGQVRFTRAR